MKKKKSKPKTVIPAKSYYGCLNELDDTDKRKQKYHDMYIKKGFEPTETWNLDLTIAAFVYPRLKYYSENMCSTPILDEGLDWKLIVSKMLYSFKALSADGYNIWDPEEDKKIQEGLDLFAKYFRTLWD